MTDTSTIYTAHDVPDLLNALPTLFGFRPSESLVAVATRGARRRFGFRLRVDIPPPRHVNELGELVAGHLRNQGAEGAILIAVTEQQDIARLLLDAVQHHLGGIEVVVAARADGSRYWADAPGFPDDGIAYETSSHHLSIVKAVAAGQQILPDREALAARFKPVEEPQRGEMLTTTEKVMAEIVHLLEPTNGASVVHEALGQLEPILARGLASSPVSDEDVARLSVWVSQHDVRQEVWGRISRANAPEMLAFLTHVSGLVVPPFEPAVLSLTAFAAWLSGDGAQALMAVERALDADRHCPMAHGVLQLLEGGVSPMRWGRF